MRRRPAGGRASRDRLPGWRRGLGRGHTLLRGGTVCRASSEEKDCYAGSMVDSPTTVLAD